MYRRLALYIFAIILICGPASEIFASDWYVANVAKSGKGSIGNPFNEIQKAIDSAEIGDVIHVAQGTYTGKLRVGYLVIDKRGLTLVGGYKDQKFGERNPFTYVTRISEDPKSKNSTFDGEYIRVTHAGSIKEHRSTTIDGFWFDRKGQNKYDDKGNLRVPSGSNIKPILTFQQPDCHVLNCVFVNSASYAVRVTGDGSSVRNCIFVNPNYAGIDVYGKGETISSGYQYPKILIDHCTFVSAWNSSSDERGAGSFIVQNGGADLTISACIFNLSNGTSSSMGYVFKDEKNFKSEKWIHFIGNSVSRMKGGIASMYVSDLTASIDVVSPDDLKETHLDSDGNDTEDPGYEFDAGWLKRYKMADQGKNLGTWYPLADVESGAFFIPSNKKLAKRGVQTEGSFPVVKGKLLSGIADVDFSNKEYREIDWATLWKDGESLVGKAVTFKAYYLGWDYSQASGFGEDKVYYMQGASEKSHKIISLRKIEAFESSEYPLKGYLRIGSKALDYIEKKARTYSADKKKASAYSFIVSGTVKKAKAKVNMGNGPQIVIDIDSIEGGE
jgi:hypothetical protein